MKSAAMPVHGNLIQRRYHNLPISHQKTDAFNHKLGIEYNKIRQKMPT